MLVSAGSWNCAGRIVLGAIFKVSFRIFLPITLSYNDSHNFLHMKNLSIGIVYSVPKCGTKSLATRCFHHLSAIGNLVWYVNYNSVNQSSFSIHYVLEITWNQELTPLHKFNQNEPPFIRFILCMRRRDTILARIKNKNDSCLWNELVRLQIRSVLPGHNHRLMIMQTRASPLLWKFCVTSCSNINNFNKFKHKNIHFCQHG